MTLSATYAPAAARTASTDVNNVDYHHPGACAGLGPNAGAGTASCSVMRPSGTNSNSKQRQQQQQQQLGVHVQHINASSSSSPSQFSHASFDSNLPQRQMQQSHLSSAALTHHSHHSPSLSSTQNNNTSSTSNSGASSTATRPRMTRNNSHLSRTGPGALVIPIPPTLANSPHLQSPNSIFRRPYAGPRASPDVEEERWLRDTVPMGSAAPPLSLSAGPPATGSGMGYTCTTAATGAGMLGEQGRGRSASTSSRNTTSPSTSPAFSLLPSSLPRQGVYAHGQTLSPRERG
ncbi:hypothetical protein ACEPAH_5040 [Sanghuangporus vaninii]